MSFSLIDEITTNYDPIKFERNAQLDGLLNLGTGLLVLLAGFGFLWADHGLWFVTAGLAALAAMYIGYALYDLKIRKKPKTGSFTRGILSYRLYNRHWVLYAAYTALKYVIAIWMIWPFSMLTGDDEKYNDPAFWMMGLAFILVIQVPAKLMTFYQYECFSRTCPCEPPVYEYGKERNDKEQELYPPHRQ